MIINYPTGAWRRLNGMGGHSSKSNQSDLEFKLITTIIVNSLNSQLIIRVKLFILV